VAVLGEDHRNLSDNVVSSTLCYEWVPTHNFSGDRH